MRRRGRTGTSGALALLFAGGLVAAWLSTAAGPAASAAQQVLRTRAHGQSGVSLTGLPKAARAGQVLHAVLYPTVAGGLCSMSVRGPYQGQARSWSIDTGGKPVAMTVQTRKDATPGDWAFAAKCAIKG